ncbi:hypothetical protein F8M41_019163 [Gigaspora margarita]|uniref:Uncharacterized protein n=1 Tax=Gigaspora margarita TaxID=4874 RepID=A0A8H4EKU5_GIGMA|nr:hypothetical protein F8M41_019163 [Gigaspora margarita]
METFSEEEVEINTEQVVDIIVVLYRDLDFDNAISFEENEEIKKETVAYFTALPSGFATVFNVLNIEDYINNNEQDLNQEQELTQEQIQRKRQIQEELRKKAYAVFQYVSYLSLIFL